MSFNERMQKDEGQKIRFTPLQKAASVATTLGVGLGMLICAGCAELPDININKLKDKPQISSDRNPTSEKENEIIRPYAPFADPRGGTCRSVQLVTLCCLDPETEIRYTKDGSKPTKDSTLYTGSIIVDKDMTIKAIAINKNGTDSAIMVEDYIIQKPHIMPAAVGRNVKHAIFYPKRSEIEKYIEI